MAPGFLQPDWELLEWTSFLPFAQSRTEIRDVPTGPGVYRIRVSGQDRLAYIGQTGRNLRERLGDLMRHTLAEEMPFNDPHTAAPKLWSYRRAEGRDFELSAALVEVGEPERLALECYLLWRYRTEFGASTLCNFGRLAPGYQTSRNRKTGIRGGPIPDLMAVAPEESLPPLPLRGQPASPDWMGLDWSEPEALRRDRVTSSLSGPGLYLLLRVDGEVDYIGQSDQLANRLRSHCLSCRGEPDMKFTFSRMPGGSTQAHRLEWENDLIGAYYGERRSVPGWQFRKDRGLRGGADDARPPHSPIEDN